MNSSKSNLLLIIFLTAFAWGCSSQTDRPTTKATLYWENSSPQEEGINAVVLDSIHMDIENGKYGLIDHFLVIRNSKVVYDKGYDQDYQAISKNYDTTNHQYNYDHPQWHPFYNNTSLHTLQSVSKSITSLLVGIAVDEGLMIPLDSAVYPLFDNYQFDLNDDRKTSITLRNLLTMRSGILWDESASYSDIEKNNCTAMELSDNWIQYVLDQPMDTIPGTQFVYNSGATVLLGKILRKTTGIRIDEWAEEKLFGPLGIDDYYWKKTPQGEIDTEGGLYLSTHDLAKIGYLMLNNGVWENKRIVSENWVKESMLPRVKLNATIAYGYQWWVPEYADNQPKIFAGNGYGGQFLMIAEEYDLIVVFNGWSIHDRTEKSSWRAMQERIIPALN